MGKPGKHVYIHQYIDLGMVKIFADQHWKVESLVTSLQLKLLIAKSNADHAQLLYKNLIFLYLFI